MIKKGSIRKYISGIKVRLMGVFSIILLLILTSSLLFIQNGNHTVYQYHRMIETIAADGEIRGEMKSLVQKFEKQCASLDELQDSANRLKDFSKNLMETFGQFTL